jgi:hypothetical protein
MRESIIACRIRADYIYWQPRAYAHFSARQNSRLGARIKKRAGTFYNTMIEPLWRSVKWSSIFSCENTARSETCGRASASMSTIITAAAGTQRFISAPGTFGLRRCLARGNPANSLYTCVLKTVDPHDAIQSGESCQDGSGSYELIFFTMSVVCSERSF